jgi:hypothetical protein
VNAFVAGARLALRRLYRPRVAVSVVVALVVVALGAMLERRISLSRASDHALTGVAFGLALPLLAYALLSEVTGGARLDRSLWELGRWGASRRTSALGLLAATGVWLGGCGAVLACAAVLIGRAAVGPGLARDLYTSGWIGLLGGFAYAWVFGCAASFGSKGGGRVVALLADWVLGSGATALAVPWPRGHLRNLLGAEPILHMSQGAALVAVVLLTVAAAGMALVRLPE